MILTVALQQELQIFTADIASAYLNAKCLEVVWTIGGPEFGDLAGKRFMIRKALDGLSSSARAWAICIGDFLIEHGFSRNLGDESVFTRQEEDGSISYIAVYVDDLIIASHRVEHYKQILESRFELSSNGELKEFLGMDFEFQEDNTILVTGETYISEAVKEAESVHGTLHPTSTPGASKDRPELDDSEILSPHDLRAFQQLIGQCQWLVSIARPDIAFVVNSLARFQSCARQGHLARAIRIMRYLKTFPRRGIVLDPTPMEVSSDYTASTDDGLKLYRESYGCSDLCEIDPSFPYPVNNSELTITAFVDANLGSDDTIGRACTGYIIFAGHSPIAWVSKRQKSVATSTYSAEYAALRTTSDEIIAMRYQLQSLGVAVPTARVYGDNEGVVRSSTLEETQLKARHNILNFHRVRQCIAAGIMDLSHVTSAENVADVFTKVLSALQFESLIGHFLHM
jgi:hypothetical protein